MNDTHFKVYGYRWVVLVAFAIINAIVQLNWIVFAPITVDCITLYNKSAFWIVLLSMSFMVVYIFVSVPASYIIDRYGIRIGVGIGAVLTGVFGYLRGVYADDYTMVAVSQFALYASYSVWWGGHAYGPRYLVDMLPLLIPLGAEGAAVVARKRLPTIAAGVALVWSVALAATGAFSYPAERWNTSPDDVDRRHERLWNWRDPQFVRCWTTGLSPQNFGLFRAGAPRAEDYRPPR